MKRNTAAALVGLWVLTACGGSSSNDQPKAPTTQSISGHVTVKDVVPGIHKSCSSKWLGPNDDITSGTQLVVKNASGTVVASTALFGGTLEGSTFFDYACRYSWIATVPKSAFYQLRIASYNAVTVSSADATAGNGDLSVNAN